MRGVPQTPTLRIPWKLQPKPRVLGFFDSCHAILQFSDVSFSIRLKQNQRNLRPMVSVGVSTECVRLEFEGHHANGKNGCYIFKQNLSQNLIGAYTKEKKQSL